MDEKQIVFISCGQYTDAEKALGKKIEDLVNALTPFRGYFAENQNSFKGVADHILSAMYRSVGFVAVMHSRGKVNFPDGRSLQRASVWVEQEIAIATFIEQCLGRTLPAKAYVQNGIALEGLRDKVLLNPVAFTSDGTVLDDLRETLPKWTSIAGIGAPAKPEHIRLRCFIERGIADNFIILLKNESNEEFRITRIRLQYSGQDLTAPLEPEQEISLVRANVKWSIGRRTNPDPAVQLRKLCPNSGLKFDVDVDVVFECEIAGEVLLKTCRRRVKVYATPSSQPQIKDLGVPVD